MQRVFVKAWHVCYLCHENQHFTLGPLGNILSGHNLKALEVNAKNRIADGGAPEMYLEFKKPKLAISCFQIAIALKGR